MDFISTDFINKAHLDLTIKNTANNCRMILGEAYRYRYLWKNDSWDSSYIHKLIIKSGKIYYQAYNDLGVIRKTVQYDDDMPFVEFFTPSYLCSATMTYQLPQFLKLGHMVIKTEEPHTNYMIAEHFTKKLFFIAYNVHSEGGTLYAADIRMKNSVIIAEKVETGESPLTALVVDQFTGDVILAFGTNSVTKEFAIRCLEKMPFFSQMITPAEVSEDV